jgi:hypothetical protein
MVPVANPPRATPRLPPALTIVLLALPPISAKLELSTVPIAVAPPETPSSARLLRVADTIVPPDETIRRPSKSKVARVVLTADPPANTTIRPPSFIVVPLTRPPEKTSSTPPSTSVPVRKPPAETFTTPASIVPVAAPPESTFAVPKLRTLT